MGWEAIADCGERALQYFAACTYAGIKLGVRNRTELAARLSAPPTSQAPTRGSG